MNHFPRFQAASDQSLIVYFGDKIAVDINQSVLRLLRMLQAEPVLGIRNLHPGYSSLLIKFDAMRMSHSDLEAILRSYIDRQDDAKADDSRPVTIPVCYDQEFAPDLNDVATMHGLTRAQVIKLHTSAEYLVYFLGFIPGFAYMGGLPETLATPRLATPRAKVSPGSVGIAGNQTAIYPLATPGGWRLIGRTPLPMFRSDRTGMCLLSTGDRVRFVPISGEQFAQMENSCR